MAAAMESPLAFPDSPMEPDDSAYPCKGCGQILEEGKAFELAGNRWHIDCFRCNTCGTLLDSDANLLLLGDGSLICNNCTYSCSNCGNKIEDLAILTGDQAFCATCFKCRNCKRKIENLRYARTSQGIFCMDCHEALMARRRKKTAKSTRSKLGTHASDKALPAIPPPEARKTAYIPESQSSPFQDVYAEPPGAEVPSVGKTVSELQADPDSRPSTSDQNTSRDMLTLPSTTFRNNRHSMMSQRSDLSGGGGEEFLIPLAFDPTPQPATSSPNMSNPATQKSIEERSTDYFPTKPTPPIAQAPLSKSNTSSPHIAYQEKGRLPSRDFVEQKRKSGNLSRSGSATASPYMPVEQSRQPEDSPRLSQIARISEAQQKDKFKLEAAPKTKKLSTSTPGSRSEASTPRADALADPVEQYTSNVKTLAMPDIGSPSDRGYSTPGMSNESSPAYSASHVSPKPAQLPAASILQNLPQRGDSLDSAKRNQTIPRKELSPSANITPLSGGPINGISTTPKAPTDLAKANGGKVISGPIGSPDSKSIFDTADASTPHDLHGAGSGGKANESFIDPRMPPLPPADHSRSRNESFGTLHSEHRRQLSSSTSPGLLRYSAGGDFSMDEDMARIMAAEETNPSDSFLKRVSNSVRHGRSYSDRTGRLSKDRWPRSPAIPGSYAVQEISSPSSASPEHRDELAWFKNELRRERQKTVEREKRIAELEMHLDSADVKQVNVELKEKRSTMVVLDTQKEIVIRELEVLTEHLANAKHTGERFDLGKMSNTVLRDFAGALEKLRDSFAPQIELSIQKRNDLVDEISNLAQMKDKSFMEFEQLSSKNAQLAELNNQLVHQIQGLYKANSGVQEQQKTTMNGLGIYSHHKEKSQLSFDSRDTLRNMSTDLTNIDSASTLQGEAEPVTVIQGPHVVNIRPKKFDWRKGQKVAKGVTKGLKGAFSSTQQTYSRDLQFAETGAYGVATAPGQEYSNLPRNNSEPNKQGGFGFFNNQKTAPKPNGLYAQQGNASTPSLLAEAGAQLYGSELEQRAEFEKTSIPGIVRRCVEEVESRGMDVEGIYRKSGGNSQVQQVKDWFENPTKDFDISDPDLDIHAVTSGLKQYFRKLPTPLVTFEVYDKLLDTTSIEDKGARIDAMQRALDDLPRVHYETLDYLIGHLVRVVLQEKDNLMTSMNIAVVFAPTIMRPESVSRELSDTKIKNEAVMWLVENSERIFGR